MDQNRSRKPELLAPASSLEVLKTAVIFGADAVYIGGEAFGLRAKARNFSLEDMAEGIRFAHERDIFSAMDLEYLDYYMSAPCRTGKAVMNTPLKPYCQVVPSQTDSSPVPVPLPKDVSLCYLKCCKGISVGASARSNQWGFYKTEKENLLSC